MNLHVDESGFDKDWHDFLKILVSLYIADLSEREIGEKFAEKDVRWIGRVKKLNLDRDIAQGIDLEMGTPHVKIDERCHLRANHIVLHFRDDVPDSWKGCHEGDLVAFRAKFRSNTGVRPAVGLSVFNHGAKVTLKLGLVQSELIEIL